MTATREQFHILLAKGYTPGQIGAMSQAEVKSEIDEARDQGITEKTPIGSIGKEAEYAPSPSKDDLLSKIAELSAELENIKWRYDQFKIVSMLIIALMTASFYLYIAG